MTFKVIPRGTGGTLLILVLCLSPSSRVDASSASAVKPRIALRGAKLLRYQVAQKFYKVKSGKDYANLSDPLPLNDFIEDLGKRIGMKRIVPPEIAEPHCTDDEPCKQVWIREGPDPEYPGMRRMEVWLQRDPPAEQRCEYVVKSDNPLRQQVGAGGEEDAQKLLLKVAAMQLVGYDQRRNSGQGGVLLAAQ